MEISKREIFSGIYDARISIIVILTVLTSYSSFYFFTEVSKVLGITGVVIVICFLYSCLFSIKFKTKNNYALVTYDDILLDRTLVPGDFIILLPGFSITEDKDGLLLSTEEQSLVIPDAEFQFKKGEVTYREQKYENKKGSDSIKAKDGRFNYYFDKYRLFHFITRAPEDWEKAIASNIVADFAHAFQNRIHVLEEAQGFKDFLYKEYEDGSVDENDLPGRFLWDIDPIDASLYGEYETINEVVSTLKRMLRFGIHPANITFGVFEDSAKTDELRNAIKQQEFKNSQKESVTGNTKERTKDLAEFYKSQGYSDKEALTAAINQIAREDGSRVDYGGKAGVFVNPPGSKNN